MQISLQKAKSKKITQYRTGTSNKYIIPEQQFNPGESKTTLNRRKQNVKVLCKYLLIARGKTFIKCNNLLQQQRKQTATEKNIA